MWFTNLVQFEDVAVEPDPAGAPDVLVVSWRVPGDSIVARGGLDLDILTTGQGRTVINGRNPQERPPLWSLETLAVIGTSTGSLLVGEEPAGSGSPVALATRCGRRIPHPGRPGSLDPGVGRAPGR